MTTPDRDLPTARWVARRPLLVGSSLVVLFGLAVVAGVVARGAGTAARVVFVVIAVHAFASLVVSVLPDRLQRIRPREAAGRPSVNVTVLVPVYNEDSAALRRCLRSFFEQVRRPQTVIVVDDGSTVEEYEDVRRWFLAQAARTGVRTEWVRTPNRGKRHAQVEGVRRSADADVYVTVDSDSILDRRAIENGLAPFSDERVQSVAALILTTNYRESVLARWMDLYCLGLQLFERSAFSRFHAVMVNSGGCAFYRAGILRDNVDAYLGETILGRAVQFSDDSMLTLFALRRGRAVQRADCFAFTLMPADVGHHLRQQLRWMRGSFIRSLWRFRYLPFRRPAYWLHLVKWGMHGLVTATLVHLLLTGTLLRWETVSSGLLAAVALWTMSVLRYALVVRSDQGTAQRWATIALAPVAAVWGLVVLRVLRWYAVATFARTGWGTRVAVEVRDAPVPG